jgi:O-acetyl-ADP-ribose deacetylase (regulator of RNase III)
MAKITKGYRLPAKHVIHTVGPIWHGGTANEPALLASCYRESLSLAAAHGLASVAFPAISCGVYGYPIPDAARVAVGTVAAFLEISTAIDRVIFACFGDPVRRVFQAALDDLRAP